MSRANLPLPDPYAFTSVHYHIGLALWHIQAFEEVLCYFITLILKLPPSRGEQETKEVLEKLQSRTLGQLITELRKKNSTNSVSAFEKRMDHFLNERNWLVHKSWSQHHGDVFNVDRLPPLLVRLEALTQEAEELRQYFGQLTTTWTIQDGHTREEIDKKTMEILKQRGIVD